MGGFRELHYYLTNWIVSLNSQIIFQFMIHYQRDFSLRYGIEKLHSLKTILILSILS